MTYEATLQLTDDELKKLLAAFVPDRDVFEALAVYGETLVEERLQSAGVSGGQTWPGKWRKAIGADDGRSLLTGPSAELRKRWSATAEEDAAVIWNDSPYAPVHEQGTLGKGGKLPDIKPRKAKALFIPTSPKGESSVRLEGPMAADVRRLHHKGESEAAYRTGVKYRKVKGDPMAMGVTYTPLVRGRLKDGKLQRWNERMQVWEDGIPDYIFLKVVSIPPRPCLPTSPPELQKLTEFAADLLIEKAEHPRRRHLKGPSNP